LGRELARALLGDSQRIEPQRLLASGYSFRHPELDGALRAMFT
jgi:NAD dependent epimerase/dehydratase family enzyme